MQLCAKIQEARKAVSLANEAADASRLSKNRGLYEKPFECGDIVQLFRPQNRLNKEQNFKWGTTVKILKCEDLLAKVEFENKKQIWVHRNQCRLVEPRPDHLKLDISTIETDLTEKNQSGGGEDVLCQDKVSVSKPYESNNQPESPAIVQQQDSSASNNSRRPQRARKKPDRLGFTSYAAAVKC